MDSEKFLSQVASTEKAFRRFLVALCCGDTALADDIAQEAYIKAYLSSTTLNNPDKFKAWIYRIGYNTFVNHKRSKRTFSDYEQVSNVATSDASDASFKYQELYAALNMLPDNERMSLLLFYIEGYTVKEIGEIVKASQDAVKKHLSRGRKHLRGLLSTKTDG